MPPPIGVTATPSGLVLPLSRRTDQPAGSVPPLIILSMSCCCAMSAVALKAANPMIARMRCINLLMTPSLVDPVVLQSENALDRAGWQHAQLQRLIRNPVLHRRQTSEVHDHRVTVFFVQVRKACPGHRRVGH